MTFFILLVFVVGYLAIVFEHPLKIHKTASALIMAVLTWMFVFLSSDQTAMLGEKMSETAQIIFFLMGAITLVEVIDAHKGFRLVTEFITTDSKRKLIWVLGLITFFLSSVLDNLTTTVVMVSLLRKLVPDHKDRLMLGSMVVIAANAGGAWTPIGDVTTTMLWINGNISTMSVMKVLFLPSIVSLLVVLMYLTWSMKGRIVMVQKTHEEVPEGSKLVFFMGIGALIFVPIFKALTGMPPFMGILIAVGVLWLITDLLHAPYETRQHLRLPQVLSRIDTSGVLFFLGILLCIGALDVAGLLHSLATFLNNAVGNISAIAYIIGLISAVIDNVPLVAAGMGMYSLNTFPADSYFWQLLAFCAGTGGSILIIGSAAGVAFMGLEKVDFLWYLRRISLLAFVSYTVGVGVILLERWIGMI